MFVLAWFISAECNGLKKDLIGWAIYCRIELEIRQKHTMRKANATCDNLYMLKHGKELDSDYLGPVVNLIARECDCNSLRLQMLSES